MIFNIDWSKKISILNTLSIYKFLSRSQMAKLGIDKYNSSFSRHCRPLLEAKFIGVMDAAKYGLGHIYYLTKKGAEWIAQEKQLDLICVDFCNNKPRLSLQSLFHRTHAIDCQIELMNSCTTEKVIFYDRDIESVGSIKRASNLERKTRIPLRGKLHLEPDAIFMLYTPVGNKLYCLEYEHKDYTKKSYQKVLLHLQALNLKSPSEKYGHDKAHRTLFIYQNPGTMKSVMAQLILDVPDINSWILFKSLKEVVSPGQFKNSIYQTQEKKNFLAGWQQANGERKMLY